MKLTVRLHRRVKLKTVKVFNFHQMMELRMYVKKETDQGVNVGLPLERAVSGVTLILTNARYVIKVTI